MTTLCSSRSVTLLLSFASKRSVLTTGNLRQCSSSFLSMSHQKSQRGFYTVSPCTIGPLRRRTVETQIFQRSLSLSSRLASESARRSIPREEDVERDEFPKEEDLDQAKPYIIYEGALTKQLKHVKIISLTTSCMGLFMQPMLLNAPDTPLAATIALLGMVGFFTYVTPVMIHMLAKRYVTEIIYDPQQKRYTAALYTFFLQRREMTFTKDDVTVPDAPGPLTSMVINSKDGKKTGIFVALESFIYPVHYGKMMGYDKPLDLHLAVEEVVKQKQKDKDNKDALSSKQS